ncbi:amidoligase family protein, partial [Herbiconiux daphne]
MVIDEDMPDFLSSGSHAHSFDPNVGQSIPRLRRRNADDNSQTFSGNVPEGQEMTTIASEFGLRASYPSIEQHPLIVGTNLAGVEIELENLRMERPRFNYWTAKGDGSLRNNGMEFVFSSPWGGVDLYNAAIEIDSFLFDNNPDDNWRCSTHVHIDVRNMNVKQLKRLVLAYVFYERVLFKCSGWHRYKNNFCMALGFAQEQLSTLSTAWQYNDGQFLNHIISNWDKYSAMNFLPMSTFGSVEFRISEAKWRKGRLIRLVNRFISLKEIAMNSDVDDAEFIELLINTPIQKVIRKGLPRQLPEVQEDIEVGGQ